MFDKGSRLITAFDMPTAQKTVGGMKREVMDHQAFGDLLDTLRDIYGVQKTVVEQVSGMAGQASGFQFGFGVGCIHQGLFDRQMPFETVTPGQWKKQAKVPKDKKEAIARADQVFAGQRQKLRNERGTAKDGRAEAALMAWWLAGMPVL